MNAVVAVGTDGKDGSRQWVGTGFFVARVFREEATWKPVLVTNKHVIQDLDSAYVRVNPRADGPAREFEVRLTADDGEGFWKAHPDPDVDIAVTPIDADLVEREGLAVYVLEHDTDCLTLDQMRESHVSEGDAVYVLGFPMGIVGGDRSAVIARSGCIARIQDTLAGANKTFLVDASVYPGNSGGPVILAPQTATVGTAPLVDRALLLGIVAAFVPYVDTAVSPQTGRTRVAFEENSGLGLAHPTDYILDLIPEADEPEDDASTATLEEIDPSEPAQGDSTRVEP